MYHTSRSYDVYEHFVSNFEPPTKQGHQPLTYVFPPSDKEDSTGVKYNFVHQSNLSLHISITMKFVSAAVLALVATVSTTNAFAPVRKYQAVR